MARRIAFYATRGIAYVAVGVLVFAPLSYWVLMLASLAAALVFGAISFELKESDTPDEKNTGYWPEPLDWSPDKRHDDGDSR